MTPKKTSASRIPGPYDDASLEGEVQSAFTKLFSGRFTDRAMWLVASGSVCLIIGLFGAFYSKRA